MKNTASLQLDYVMAASYYWFKASNPDEQLVSALNRMKAGNIAVQLGILTPPAADVEAYARDRWPVHQLHGPAFKKEVN